MSYVYKQFTAQDIAKIPFIAHKQYNFDSSSAASNQVTYLTSSYTSESVSLFTSASTGYGSDIYNVVKYNQIDHLFFRNYRKKVEMKNDFIHWIYQRRDLYEKANIISIPLGLYGHQIRKNSFFLSSSNFEITDDSYGNLIVSGTNTSNYPQLQECIFRLDPINGHKRYDLSVFDGYAVVTSPSYLVWDVSNNEIFNPSPSQVEHFGPVHQVINKEFWRQGTNNPDSSATYTSHNRLMKRTATKDGISSSWYEPFPINAFTEKRFIPLDNDDTIFDNPIHYENVSFKESTLGSTNHKFPTITFNSATSSFIRSPHATKYNFNTKEEFAISFWITPNITGSEAELSKEKRYIIAKSGTSKETVTGISASTTETVTQDVANDTNPFPYEIYMTSQSLYFSRSDQINTHTISGEITASGGGTAEVTSHVLCQYSGSIMELWLNGAKIASTTSNLENSTRNQSYLYIGSKGLVTETDGSTVNNNRFFNGDLNNINIFTRPFNTTEIANISASINGSPYIGNCFYKTGFGVITHPKYTSDVLSGSDSLHTLQFQGSHLIYEHEYQCTIQEHEYNYSTNQSMLESTTTEYNKLKGITSQSFFSPYVTTIGLYNEAYELLAVAKLGQPIRMSDQTDTTFVVRWDT